MKITELLTDKSILINSPIAGKEAAVSSLLKWPAYFGLISDVNACRADIMAREAQGSTGLPNGLAIPHAKSRFVDGPVIAALTVPTGVDFGAADGTLSRVIFLLLGPENDPSGYLEMLSALLKLFLKDEKLVEKLADAKTYNEFLDLVRAAEE